MKILWNSNAPWVPSGYGQQIALFAPRIAELGYDTAIAALYGLEGARIDWNGIPVYPTDHTRFNKYALRQHVKDFSGDDPHWDTLVIPLQDVWVWPDASRGGMAADYEGLRLAPWVPVDHNPLPVKIMHALKTYDARPIAMSRFGLEQLEQADKAGCDFRPLYVPHGVDTNVMRPRDADEWRAKTRIPKDAFVVGMVANNNSWAPPRKAFPEMLLAFAMFAATHDDAYMYVHSDVEGFADGINLAICAQACGMPDDRLAFVDLHEWNRGSISQEDMSVIYSGMDVLANPSYGEGFGVPIVEAQACGTPVIVSDWTSMPELVGAGWIVDGEPWYVPGHASWWLRPSVQSLVTALEQAYENRGDKVTAAKAVEFAQQYDADRVTGEFWKPVLEELERPREVAPLARPNRAQRRAMAKAAP